MDMIRPIYTEVAQCQDCYKCLRNCSVKAIEIEEGHARVMSDLCVICGNCVKVCPVGAKKVRDDIKRARVLLQMKERVVVSLAPSYISEFKNVQTGRLVEAIESLGFYGVSETALGAQEVSANISELMAKEASGIFISSACPTVVELIHKFYPSYADRITDLLSPVLAHCKMLRQQYGPDIGIVFVGPCIAKKLEADTYSDLLNVALTFEELRRWLDQEGVVIENGTGEDKTFMAGQAMEGALYPVDGGMVAGIKANCAVHEEQLMSFSGINAIHEVMKDLDELQTDKPVFIEMLACEGGCVNGPCTTVKGATAVKRQAVIGHAHYPDGEIPRKANMDLYNKWQSNPVVLVCHGQEEIEKALHRVGKYRQEDELNCGGCGYDSCRDFAEALLSGRAEPSMCVGYMRQLAHKKADALIKTMPSGAVIVNDEMRIVECNRRFAAMMGEDSLGVYEACPGMEGASARKIMPFHDMFSQVLKEGEDTIDRQVKINHLILRVTVFTIEPHRLVGGIMQDITTPSVEKEQVITKAKEVITKNLATVQKIAFLLGENAADSEVILNSIIQAYSPDVQTGINHYSGHENAPPAHNPKELPPQSDTTPE